MNRFSKLAIVLAAWCLLVWPAAAQVTLQRSKAHYSTVDQRKLDKGEAMWEAVVRGRRTGVTMIYLWQPEEKPKLLSQFANRRGDAFFTVSNNFSDIGWSESPATYLFRRGRAVLVSREWVAVGLSGSGDILLSRDEGTYMAPSESPYDHVTRMQVKRKGKLYDLGVLSAAKLAEDGYVTGYWFEDSSGKRGNGYQGAWVQQWFRWKDGKLSRLGKKTVQRGP